MGIAVVRAFYGSDRFKILHADRANRGAGIAMRTRPHNVSIPSYRGVEVRRPEALRASVSRTTIFIMPTRASVCSTGGRLQMVKFSKRSVGKFKSYEH